MSQFEKDKVTAVLIADTLHTRLRHKHRHATPQAVVMGLALLVARMDKATGSGTGRAFQNLAVALLGGVKEPEEPTAPDPSSAPTPDFH